MASDMDDEGVEASKDWELPELSNTPIRAEDATLAPETVMAVLEDLDHPAFTQPMMRGPRPTRKLEPDFLWAAKDVDLFVKSTTTEQAGAMSRALFAQMTDSTPSS